MAVKKDKKPGQQYVPKELRARGWTNQLMDERLESHCKNGRIYYLASDVHREESVPEVAAMLSENTALNEEHNRIAGVSTKQRIAAALILGKSLDKAIADLDVDTNTKAVVNAWHRAFMDFLREPYPSGNKVLAYTAKEIEKNLSYIRDGRFSEKKFRHAAKSAWLFGYEGHVEQFTALYVDCVKREAKEECQTFLAKVSKVSIEELLSIPAVEEVYPLSRDLYFCYLTYYVPDSISRDLSQMLEVDPKNEYPAARCMKRTFKIHVGGTNTGKTYQSLQRLRMAASGVYLAPLRLLALEVQEKLLECGVVCSMLTGEEEDLRPGATHMSSTVEKLDINRLYDVGVIDECQMIADVQRGFAWTRAILGVQAEEVHLCVAPEGLNILKRLLDDTNEKYEVITHERKVPLTWQNKTIPLKKAQKGDAFVAFSKRSVLQMAEELRQNGNPASVIYGDLPYATRRQQMQRFLDGETEILVATDAIGMGLNLPIRRVVFTAAEKFDGVERRPLLPGEVRQIAGRAGRFGIYDEGFAASGPYCPSLENELNTLPEPVRNASLGFSDLVLKVDFPLADVLRVWNQMPVKKPYVRMDISRYIFIIGVIQSELKLNFSKEDLLRAGNIPFDERNERLMVLFRKYTRAYADNAKEMEKPVLSGNRLNDLESYYKMLDLYYSFSKVYHLEYDREWLAEEKQMVADEINHLLIHELDKRGASCRICGGPLKLSSRYGICESCYQAQKKDARWHR